MKRHYVGTVLVGFGALFAVFAVGLPLYVGPAVTKVPNDLQACPAADKPQPAGCLKPSVAEAPSASFLQVKDGKLAIQHGTLRSTVEVLPRADITANWQASGKLGDDAVIWDVYQTVNWLETGDVISAYSTELALDRVSGAAADWDGQWLDDADLGKTNLTPRNVKYQGQIYKFPFGTEKVDYPIFDRDLRRTLPARFKEATAVGGVEAYRFEQVIDKAEVAVPAGSLGALLTTFAPEATTGKLLYSNIREVWIEPTTGTFVNVRERQTKVLVPDVGPQTTLLDADFKYTPATVDNSAGTAASNASQLKLVNLYGPIGVGVLALVVIIVGLLLARRPSSAFVQGRWEAGLPRSRHRLRDDATAEPAQTTALLGDAAPQSTPTWPGQSGNQG